MFQTDISDNLSDPRYLPFEGAGAISSWQLNLPQTNNELDLSTVTDVRLHILYTALDGGDMLKQAAQDAFTAALPATSVKAFSIRNAFPASWTSFLAGGDGDQVLAISVTPAMFPAWTRGPDIPGNRFDLYHIASG